MSDERVQLEEIIAGAETAPDTVPPGEQAGARGRKSGDNELETYRSLLETPEDFHDGFTWTTVAGALFCGLLMMPGAIYISLITGGTLTAAWVTLVIFSEVSRRALKSLRTQELVVLLYVAGAMSIGGPFAALIFRQYLATSDAIRDAGLLGRLPTWWVPQPSSEAILGRNLLHHDWLIPILVILAVTVIGRIKNYTLGYFFFRLTSDVEKLPFPLAPIGAEGSMALAESGQKQTTWKWKLFSVGTMIGLGFGVLQIGVPLVTGAIFTRPIQIIPLPWYDSTTLTESFLKATPTGLVMDLGLVLVGMILPYRAVLGMAAAILLTSAMNPILYKMGVLARWQPGMDTVSATFANSIDFWMSFGLGVAAGVALISIGQTMREVIRIIRQARAQQLAGVSATARRENIWGTPPGRGDFSPYLAIGIYLVSSAAIIWLCHSLVPAFPLFFLIFFMFLYTPFISWINARLRGICGQQVEIPFVREGAYILSGYQGVDIWLAPIPIENYGAQAENFRVTELTGTKFWSYVKADVLIIPLTLSLSFVFWGFIWHSAAIPSESFPWAQKMWDLQSKQMVLLWSATIDSGAGEPLFYQALHPVTIGGGFAFTVIAWTIMGAFGVPIIAIYGFIQAVGAMPHAFIPQIAGALVGRYYMQKRFGREQFLRMVPVIIAGYGTGVGLVALMGVAVNLITNAISPSAF